MREEANPLSHQLHDLFDRHFKFNMQSQPEMATFEGIKGYDHLLSDYSDEAHQAAVKQYKAFRQELNQIDPAQLNTVDQLNHEMFALTLDEAIESAEFNAHYQPINQMTGYHLSLPQLIDIQPLQTADQFPAYFSRLKAFPQQVADVIDNMKKGIEIKLVQPRHVIEQVLPQIQNLLAGSAQDNVMYLPIANHQGLSADDKEKLGAELAQVIDTDVKPAYVRLHDFIKETYLPACRETFGLWDLPKGEAYYQFCIKSYTTPELTASEIHSIGLAEVERIQLEKQKLIDHLGYEGSVEEFDHYLRTSPEFVFESTEALWAEYERVMAEGTEKTKALFHRMPKAPCVLKAVEDYKSKSAPQAYYMPAPEDGSRPGYYYINTYDLPSRPKYAVTALTLHEAIPGHHLQLALAQEIENLPFFRRRLLITSYVEGWGLYAEYLGYQMDMYQDPYQHYGALSFEMWRACRLVVDTGLHAMHWTRQQAIDFMKRHMSNSEHDIAAEVDRYMILPGQALSYKIGELKIKQLRKLSEDTLGDKFDLRDFHDVVIRNGAVPLAVLEEQVHHYLGLA